MVGGDGTLGNLEDLIAQVRRRTEQRALALVTNTEEQAKRVVEEGRAAAAAERERLRAQGAAAAQEARRQRLAVADLTRRRRRLEAREARLERVWAGARAALDARLDDDPVPLLRALARGAAADLGGDEASVRLDAGSLAHVDAATVASWSPADGPTLTLDPTPLEHGRGVRVAHDRAAVDATLDGRLAMARERLRGEVDAVLEGSGADEGATP